MAKRFPKRGTLGEPVDRHVLAQRARLRARQRGQTSPEGQAVPESPPPTLEAMAEKQLDQVNRRSRADTERSSQDARQPSGLGFAAWWAQVNGDPAPITAEEKEAGLGSPLAPTEARPTRGTSAAAAEREAQEAVDTGRKIGEMQRVITAVKPGDMTEVAAVAFEEMKAEFAVQAAEAENDLLRAQQQLDIQDVHFQQSLKDADLDLADELDLDPLRDAVAAEGGLGAQTLQAIQDIAASATLSEAEKNESIDLVLTRSHFSDAIEETVNDMVTNLKNLETLEARSDKDMLNNPDNFLHPTVDFDLQGADDAERWLNNFVNQTMKNSPAVDAAIEAEVEGSNTMAIYREAEDLALQGQFTSPAYLSKLDKLAEAWGVDFEVTAIMLDEMFKDAANVADVSEENWNKALVADSLVPGSQEMIAAIYQAGEESGFEPNFLALVAKSVDLHMLIDVVSGGKSGVAKPGTTGGVGGLTAEMYEEMMPEPWYPGIGMQFELQALLEYIHQHHNGDPIAAVAFWRRTGEWGGSTGLGDDDVGEFDLSRPPVTRDNEPMDEFISTQEQVG